MSQIKTIGDATLYLGDCRDILPILPKVDAVVTDPPYGLGETDACRYTSRLRPTKWWKNPTTPDYGVYKWDNEPASDDLLTAVRGTAKWSIIFGGNFFTLPPARCWLIWNKMNGASNFADCELAWTNLQQAVRMIDYLWNGFQRAEPAPREHPTQKPIGVMKWSIEQLPDKSRTILDPFMGSGTTGVAAIKMGRKFVGIEREPKYFDIACRRVEEATKQPDMFIARPASALQEAFDYDGADDFAKSLDEGYAAIRERVKEGGPPWKPK